MTPTQRLEELLEQSGAVLQRKANHLVYRLPNGANFVAAKTPSDHRSTLNNISDLRRAIGIPRPPKLLEAAAVAESIPAPTPTPMPPLPTNPPPIPAPKPVQPPPPSTSLRERLEEFAKTYDAEKERLMVLAEEAEKAARMMRGLLEHAEAPWAEAALASLFFSAPAPEPEPAPAPPPPAPKPKPEQPSGRRVAVSVVAVLDAIKSLSRHFTNRDVLLALEPHPEDLDPIELRRVQQAISGVLNNTAIPRGIAHCILRGQGRRSATWERLDMSAAGTRVALSTEDER